MKIEFVNLKYLDDFQFDDSNEINLFIGQNGSGKSLLIKHLSFIHYLYQSELNIIKLFPTELYDQHINALSFNDIILNDLNESFGYKFYEDDSMVHTILFEKDSIENSIHLSYLSSAINDPTNQIHTFYNAHILRDQHLKKELVHKIKDYLEEELSKINEKEFDSMSDLQWPLRNILFQSQMKSEAAEIQKIKSWINATNSDSGIFVDISINSGNLFRLYDTIFAEQENLRIQYQLNQIINLRSLYFIPMHYKPFRSSYYLETDAVEVSYSLKSIFALFMAYSFAHYRIEEGKVIQNVTSNISSNNQIADILDALNPRIIELLRLGDNEENVCEFRAISSENDHRIIGSLPHVKTHPSISIWTLISNSRHLDYRHNPSFLNTLQLQPILESRSTKYQFNNSIITKESALLYTLLSRYNKAGFPEKARMIFDHSINLLLQIDSIKVSNIAEDASIYQMRMTRGSDVLFINSLSFGERHILISLLEFCFTDSNIIYLNEPDAYLHPNAQSVYIRQLVTIAKALNKKLIIETHSPYFLRELQLMEVDPAYDGSISEKTVVYYRSSRNPDLNRQIKIKENGDLDKDIPEGFSDHFNRLNMLRMQFLD